MKYEWAKYTRVFVPGKPFLSSVTFASKAGAYPSGPPVCLNGRLLAIHVNITLGWKDMSGINTIAY